MKKLLGLVGVGVVLASCGVSSDGRSAIFAPELRTEFYDLTTKTYVSCANLNQQSVPTQGGVSVGATGALARIHVQLKGQTTTAYDQNYVADFSQSAGTLEKNGDRYVFVFDAPNRTEADFLPQSVGAQGIIVNPAKRTIKNVAASDRVGNGQGGFYAQLTGYSDTGASTPAITSQAVPVYANCQLINDTGKPVF
ncbi:hypothetical protein [Deinococcus maricopensis]|uniref:Lipoprotein n=1 Tax=Deinococcus maricopensis (strain DSM 21211 / LMG 22137 / NRRL B-23946 / LB-34) TaxID=709986 RepID=E8U949_DEIML|nr:hypothetical protein [Deinococcus maricopensis]ADV67588.1 hypothetical protein Deima_1943 [Deinococcus maricopensis DSM 21211]